MKPWETFTNQKQWKEYIQNLIKTNNKALIKSIQIIYKLQEDDEQYKGETVNSNGVGFSRIDAEYFTLLVQKIKYQGTISPKDVAIARNKMVKYWKQLMYVAKKEIIVDSSQLILYNKEKRKEE